MGYDCTSHVVSSEINPAVIEAFNHDIMLSILLQLLTFSSHSMNVALAAGNNTYCI